MAELKDLTDEELLEIIRAGGPRAQAAFAELERRYHGKLRQWFWRRGCSVEEAKDLTQDVWLRVFLYVGRGEPIRNLPGLLWRVAQSVLYDWLRRRKLERGVFTEPEPEESTVEATAKDAAQSPEERMLVKETLAAIKQLSPRQQAVLSQWVRGARYKEIAEALGITAQTVKTHLQDALTRLRGLMTAPTSQSSARRSPDHE